MPESNKEITQDIAGLLGFGQIASGKMNAGQIVLGIFTGSIIAPPKEGFTGIMIKWFGGYKDLEDKAKAVAAEKNKQKQLLLTAGTINAKTIHLKMEWAKEKAELIKKLQ